MGLMIPSMLLKQLYTRDSLRNTAEGVRFSLKNRLSDSTVTALHGVKIDGVDVPASAIVIDLGDGTKLTPVQITAKPIDFPLRRSIDIVCAIPALAKAMAAASEKVRKRMWHLMLQDEARSDLR